MKDLPSMKLEMIGKQEIARGQFPESNKLHDSQFYKISDGVLKTNLCIDKQN